jgi:diguanylate cyclase (GGDEF)-like protein
VAGKAVNPRAPRVLIIDADADRARRIASDLERRLGCRAVVTPATPTRVASDLVVLAAPGVGNGMPAALPRRFGECPVVIMAEGLDDRLATEWILAGADDAAIPDEVGSACVRVLARATRRAGAAFLVEPGEFASLAPPRGRKGRLHSLVTFLQAAALTDPLTGLANRRAMDARLDRAWVDSIREAQDLAVIMIDVDDLKLANDQFGHAGGDALLVALADALRAQCRKGDLAARFGGDEVVVLLPRADASQAHAVAERLREDFSARAAVLGYCQPGDLRAGVGGSLSSGVASRFSTQATSARELLGLADEALYAAKRAGKGCTRVCGARSSGVRLAAM